MAVLRQLRIQTLDGRTTFLYTWHQGVAGITLTGALFEHANEQFTGDPGHAGVPRSNICNDGSFNYNMLSGAQAALHTLGAFQPPPAPTGYAIGQIIASTNAALAAGRLGGELPRMDDLSSLDALPDNGISLLVDLYAHVCLA